MDQLHHANIIISGDDQRHFVFSILSEILDFKAEANPDFWLMENQSFGIDDARDLKKWASGKPLIGEIKVSLIIAKSITYEAQNALLKILEEPPVGTYIFMNLESLGGLLPTFISRIRILQTPSMDMTDRFSGKEEIQDLARAFCRANLNEKFSIIHSLDKDKDKMKQLLRDLEKTYRQDYIIQSSNDSVSGAMKNILTAKIFSSVRGSSPKMLLEWLACVI